MFELITQKGNWIDMVAKALNVLLKIVDSWCKTKAMVKAIAETRVDTPETNSPS